VSKIAAPDSEHSSEHFFLRVLRATLPLLVWIGHFAFSYGLAAAQCTPVGLRPGGPDRLLIGGVSLAACGACALLAWRAWRILRRHGRTAGLLDRVAFLLALLALVAIAWGAMPLFLVDGCS
jgi:uncharacterized integral membrane protein